MSLQLDKPIPTNIITGFLGVGKTTTILNLLEQKPKDQRWAILVNEFGEVGVDGSLFEGASSEEQEVFIREVPGGCMCCTSGLPMQIALNMLIDRAKPDRLLIEPTGLGHPYEVLQTLGGEHYQNVLSVEKVIALVDARKLSDQRYTEHQTFNEQLEIADLIVGNKQDLYEVVDKKRLENYIQERGLQADLQFASLGDLELSLLEGASRHGQNSGAEFAAKGSITFDAKSGMSPELEQPMPQEGYLEVRNKGEGYQSIGWRFSEEKIFDKQKLESFLYSLNGVERVKAVIVTGQGSFAFNFSDDVFSSLTYDDVSESRIEIIYPSSEGLSSEGLGDNWSSNLLSCLIDSPV